MDTSPGSCLERVLADFAERYGALSRAREQMKALSVTARSKDGVVEATVGPDGEALSVRFVDGRFREMTGSQLTDIALEALATARTEVATRAAAIVRSAETWLPSRMPPVIRSNSVRPGQPVAKRPDRPESQSHDTTTSRPRHPLWDSNPPGRQSRPRRAPLPTGPRDAVLALGDAVCDATGGSCPPAGCGRQDPPDRRGNDPAALDTA